MLCNAALKFLQERDIVSNYSLMLKGRKSALAEEEKEEDYFFKNTNNLSVFSRRTCGIV